MTTTETYGCPVHGEDDAYQGCALCELESLRSRLADIEAQNRVMWDVANDREARLAEAEALLQEVYDGRQSLMSIGLVYRIGHTLNHRSAASAGTKHAYHETHEPPHCPTCECVADQPPAALTCEHGNMVGGCVA